LVLTASRAAFDVTRAAGAAYLLANDAVSSVRPDGQRTLLGRVPRACRFVQDGGEPAVIVAGDRRVASFEGAATTMLAGDHGFDTFVASRRHAAIWLLQDRGIACADLSGRVRGGGGPPPDEWAEGLADGAPPLGAVVATDRAILGLHGRTTLMLATRRDHDVTARPLQVPAPLYALHHAGRRIAGAVRRRTGGAAAASGARGVRAAGRGGIGRSTACASIRRMAGRRCWSTAISREVSASWG
jgi:hypothetical protein